jgi:hypothetical protein
MSLKSHATVLFATLSLTTPLWAQPAPTPARMRIPLDQLMKLDVLLEPSVDAKEVAAKTGERATPPKGNIKNLLISTRSGQVTWAALSVGGLLGIGDRVVLVPMSSLEYDTDDGKPHYELKMTSAQLKTLPHFDPDKAEAEGLDAAIERAKGSIGTPVGASARTGEKTGTGPGNTTEPPSLVLATRLEGATLNASDTEFGKIANASFDVKRNQIDYFLVSHGGALGVGDTTYLVPHAACLWTRVDDKPAVKLSKTAAQLETAPEYKKTDKIFLTIEQMQAANQFFGLPIDSLVD